MSKTKLGLLATASALVMSMGIAKADIVIATVGPMTGPYAAFGEQMTKGAQKAVEDLNAAGGVLGETVVLEIGDDACDPKQAVAVANQLVSKNVALVAGHFCSGSSIPASEVYFEEGILQISPASTNPQLTERDMDNVFRVCGRDDQQGEVAGKYLAENYGDKRIAIVHDKQAYSKGLADETKKNLNAAGITEVVYEAITPNEKDYSALVTKLKSENIDILYYGGYHTELGLIVRQMRSQGMDTAVMSGDALNSLEYWAITGDAGSGTLFTNGPKLEDDPRNAELVKYYEGQGYVPEGYTLYTYGAVQAWAQAVAKAGTVDSEAVSEALKSGDSFDTVLGSIAFDAKGDVAAPGYVIYKWEGGAYDYVN
ncbi:branched-chain amino acid ABC transporter substrate-binding protein [Thalassospira sp.]|uniref:branched-chain amino acid ABC transporter substrate-binding protein n=1 Tax=Thalassospira sp. TaxID=1912094 RepID=UPI0027344342|nr:branched-chain amino acid ABC transporter substrate-binding protein [Thalassospira sp.]MDP2697862.1 branched-chain amino acid ABC transporter substrate-binding protein [Thalassospira sp.]